MRAARSIVGLVTVVAALAGGGCSSGPCVEMASTVDTLHDKLLDCPDLVSAGARAYVLPEAVEACAPYAEKYCSEADLAVVSETRACIEGLAACSGDGKAFKDALDACGEKMKAVSEPCRKSLAAVDP
jgi:hypothetical protein